MNRQKNYRGAGLHVQLSRGFSEPGKKRTPGLNIAGGMQLFERLPFKAKRAITLIIGVIAIAVAVLTAGEVLDCGDMPSWSAACGAGEASVVSGGDMEVHVIDVGQGDCVLVRGGGANILIDAGENGMGTRVVSYLEKQGVYEIDLAVCTHPHSDHIGGMDQVIAAVETDAVLMPEIPDSIYPTTATYMQLLDAMDKRGLRATYARVGDSMTFGDMTMTVLFAGSGSPEDGYNDYSLMLRFECGGMSYLCGGDLSSKYEQKVIESGAQVRSTLFKASHHGSADSNSEEFLDAVSPEQVFICCGAYNDYGHPHDTMLKRLRDRNISYMRTDISGSIVYKWDGEKLCVESQK